MALTAFVRDCMAEWFKGSWRYWLWMLLVLGMIGVGAWHYGQQLNSGLIVTHMSNQVSWGFYIANFTFLVGVAAAAVMLVIPAYIFDRKDIKDVVLMGDTMAIAAVSMAMLFVIADLGRPDRIWHIIPGIGAFNFPQSLLAWDVVVLNVYLLLNLHIPGYLLWKRYRGERPSRRHCGR